MDRDDGTIDWDAAFESLVAQLRPSRYVRLGRLAGQAALAALFFSAAGWTLMRLVADPVSHLGRPWL
jgi:hypothetical protein